MANCCCGLENSYENCCGEIHLGKRKAANPEELMRSRYSAFVKGEIDYLIGTHDTETAGDLDPNGLREWAVNSDWKGLEIVEAEDDIVEFKASYEVKGRPVVHHERSVFVEKDGQWLFHDGEVINETLKRSAPKVGRNDPCVCGSGKKYKKCCLA